MTSLRDKNGTESNVLPFLSCGSIALLVMLFPSLVMLFPSLVMQNLFQYQDDNSINIMYSIRMKPACNIPKEY